jgi:hypothetical protein
MQFPFNLVDYRMPWKQAAWIYEPNVVAEALEAAIPVKAGARIWTDKQNVHVSEIFEAKGLGLDKTFLSSTTHD